MSTKQWTLDANKLDFEITPRLEELVRRGHNTRFHPSMDEDHVFKDGCLVYDDRMILPADDDAHGILKWLGFNDEVCTEVKQEYEEMVAMDSPELRHRPLDDRVKRLWNLLKLVLLKKHYEDEALDVADENFEGHVNRLYELGFQPEFAVICAIHPDEDVDDEERERWYFKQGADPQEHMCEFVKTWACVLSGLWSERDNFGKETSLTSPVSKEKAGYGKHVVPVASAPSRVSEASDNSGKDAAPIISAPDHIS